MVAITTMAIMALITVFLLTEEFTPTIIRVITEATVATTVIRIMVVAFITEALPET